MYDLAIIGAGAAGISCVKEALSAKLKVALIELDKDNFGGTCINTGCIPTKFFLNSSKLGKSWENSFNKSKEIIEKIKSPLLKFLEVQGVDIIWGMANFQDKNTLDVSGKKINAKNIIVATGSSAKNLLADKGIIAAEKLFNKDKLGNKILVVGAGYIGIEFASLMNSLGKETSVVESKESILPGFDKYLSNRLKTILMRRGIKIKLSGDIKDYNLDNYDLVISAIGRSANIKGLGLEKIGLNLTDTGFVKTQNTLKTNIDNIYACGDVTGKRLLAYIAEYQAKVCVKNILGKSVVEDYNVVPECVFSLPQMARVGVSEEEAQSRNIEIKVKKSNFLKFASSYVYNDTDGFIKVVSDKNGKIIGAGVISNSAAELINIFSLCIKNGLKVEDIKKSLFVHPTISEVITGLL